MSKTTKSGEVDFEKSLKELEKIVEKMEKGDQKLEDTLKDFERGMTLSKQCQTSLNAAQLKVEKLIKKYDKYELESIEDNGTEDSLNDEDGD